MATTTTSVKSSQLDLVVTAAAHTYVWSSLYGVLTADNPVQLHTYMLWKERRGSDRIVEV